VLYKQAYAAANLKAVMHFHIFPLPHPAKKFFRCLPHDGFFYLTVDHHQCRNHHHPLHHLQTDQREADEDELPTLACPGVARYMRGTVRGPPHRH
jgi:hypothetical protein